MVMNERSLIEWLLLLIHLWNESNLNELVCGHERGPTGNGYEYWWMKRIFQFHTNESYFEICRCSIWLPTGIEFKTTHQASANVKQTIC